MVLLEKGGSRYVGIWIGRCEADATQYLLQQMSITRPLTHDFVVAAINGLGGKCLYAGITQMVKETYYAKVVIEQAGRELELDARPSDAVNIALRANVPILAEESLLGELPAALAIKIDGEVREQPDNATARDDDSHA
jgi:hypothetical protein